MTTMKRCSRCRVEYPATLKYFHRDKNKRQGLTHWCQRCQHIVRLARYELERAMLQTFDALAPDPRLACMVRRLRYGDALLCGDYALERQHCQTISDIENDSARDHTLVKGSYAKYLLYRHDVLIGVFDSRTDDCTTIYQQQDRLAHYLMTKYGWTVAATRRVEYGAITCPDTRLERAQRLLKPPNAHRPAVRQA